jgi:hypothetical protein
MNRATPATDWVAIGLNADVSDLITIYLFRPSGLWLGHLIAEVLGVGRYAGIVVNHARIPHQKSALEKRC